MNNFIFRILIELGRMKTKKTSNHMRCVMLQQNDKLNRLYKQLAESR